MQGWTCPVCGAGVAPSVLEHCKPPKPSTYPTFPPYVPDPIIPGGLIPVKKWPIEPSRPYWMQSTTIHFSES